MNSNNKFYKILSIIFSINWFNTLYFNFHYLPIKQAIKLPFFLFKSKIVRSKGSIELRCDTVKPGMIRMGHVTNSLYNNTGFIWENHGGKVVFNDDCTIGISTAISIGQNAKLVFGKGFLSTACLKIVCFHYINFGENARVAWEVLIMDSSFHRVKDKDGNFKNKGFSPIIIGKNNWITNRCIVLPGTSTPDFTIFGAGSILNKDYTKFPTHSLLAGNPIEVKATEIWRDMNDDSILYEAYQE